MQSSCFAKKIGDPEDDADIFMEGATLEVAETGNVYLFGKHTTDCW